MLRYGGLDGIKGEVRLEELSARVSHSSGHELGEDSVVALDAFIQYEGEKQLRSLEETRQVDLGCTGAEPPRKAH